MTWLAGHNADAECRVLDPGSRILDPGLRLCAEQFCKAIDWRKLEIQRLLCEAWAQVPDSGIRTQESGSWSEEVHKSLTDLRLVQK